MHTVDILIFEALDGVPTAGAGCFVASAQMVLEFLATPSSPKATRNRKWLHVGCDKNMDGFPGVLNDLWCLIAIFFIEPLLPEIGRFHHMRVGGNDIDCCHEYFLLLCSN